MHEKIQYFISNFIKYGEIEKQEFKLNRQGNFDIRVPGVYILRHSKGIYVGSTGNLNVRTSENKSELKHHNKALQSAYNEESIIEIAFILVNNRNDAYDLEQEILDLYKESNLLFNRNPLAKTSKGIKESKELIDSKRLRLKGVKRTTESIEKQRNSNLATGRKLTEEHKKILATSVQKSLELQRKPLTVNGVMYSSLTSAAKALGVSYVAIGNRIKSNNPLFKEYKFI